MFYQIIIENGYISSVVKGVSAENANCTEEEYTRVRNCLTNKPTAPEGFCYRLNENCEWVLCEVPTVDIDAIEEATEEDYQTALESLGVNLNA